MTRLAEPADRICDVLVAGAGLAGLAAAIAFARAGFDVVACGADERLARGRTVAMLARSIAYLDSLGLWPAIEPQAAPMRALRMIDDTGGLFPPRPVEFASSEIGLETFGWNVENDLMADSLAARAAAAPGVERTGRPVESYDFSGERALARLADGRTVAAALVIGADGRASPARRAAGLSVRTHRYPQSALTALLAHRLPHRDVSTEFHTRQGPFTLVPLPPAGEAADRSSLVWLMSDDEARRRETLDDAALAREIERQARSLLGAMRIEGRRGIFPMARQVVPTLTAPRLALIGDAAHAFPPIGAQGLNLGLRDVEAIVEAAVEARAAGGDIGGSAALAAYERARRADIFTRTAAVDGLNRALLAEFAPLDLARGAGLAALAAVGPLRRFVMREGVAPRFARPLPGPARRPDNA
ncbi:2-octaprenyl-6-methoxyphenol hydroxylase [Roseiarcus fermentans]|uniref:2-octaprenyl-6-methoxyphenol hydroxylase n=1 Tax=Roseiarcus fermentans TaxID=1473586 RepID=A0A366FJT7_9HYPH|nr:UbiH/UbiF family hydroxylase [Roseiarcus fermentans]RBP14376.1 2-octaprenyl-6-methoxyphenol hydroxylase [Roseiarcus fermentans]